MEQQKVFPNAMFGFDKKTVLDYIYEQDTLAKERDAQHEAAIAQAEEEAAKLKTMIDELSGQVEIAKAQLYKEKESAAVQKAAYDKLRQEADQLIQVARNKDNELQIQLELNKQLQNKYAEQEARIQELTAQLERFQSAGTIEQMTAKAAREADELLDRAKAEAQDLLEKATQKAEARSEEVTRLKEELASFKAAAAQTLAGLEVSIAKLYEDDGEEKAASSQTSGESHDIHFFR